MSRGCRVFQPRPLLSIVCPAYNEDEVLPHFHQALSDALRILDADYRIEIIYADDGSNDRTPEIVRSIAADDPRVRFVILSRNFGHQAALTAGMDRARGDAVVTLDSDLQHPPRLIPRLVELWRRGFDVVQTIRDEDRRLGWLKCRASTAFYRLLRRCSSIEVRAAASDYRLLSRRAVDDLLRMRESHRYLRGMVQWLGYPTAEVRFEPGERLAGRSKYTLRKMIRLALDGLCSFSRVPLRLPITVGLLVTALSGVATAAVALLRHLDPLVAIVLLGLHGMGMSVLLSLASLGEYVGRIHDESKRRPLYISRADSDSDGATLQHSRAA